jgi:hypothetical protein
MISVHSGTTFGAAAVGMNLPSKHPDEQKTHSSRQVWGIVVEEGPAKDIK